MSALRWSQVRRLHGEALDLPLAERRAFLEDACGGDAELLEEVWELLTLGQDQDFLEAPDSEPAAPGIVLGDFELLEELGSGGTGIVFRAKQKSLEREVAIKVMPRHFALNKSRVARFVREAKAAAKLKHPGIAQIYEVGQAGDNHYFAMELVSGRDLAAELELQRAGTSKFLPSDRSKSSRAIAMLVMQVADALAFAHAHGVVHRDVKPHNILLDEDCRPRLVDFGLAKDESLGSITVTDKVEGTPYYMSPEQARVVNRHIDARTDVYSLGVVLYELLTRSRPFEGRTSQEVLHKIIQRDPKPVRQIASEVPRDLAVICAKAMEKEPDLRYASAEAFRADLDAFLTGQPIQARPPGLVRKVLRVSKRYKLALVAVAATVLTVFGVACWARWSEQRTWPELQIQVLFADESVDPAIQRVHAFATELSPSSGEVIATSLDLGSFPFDTFRLHPGMWKITVVADDYGFSELNRPILVGRVPMPLRARVFREGVETAGLVKLESIDLPRANFGASHGNSFPESKWGYPGTGPLHLDSYFIGRTEVSFAAFRKYLEESGDPDPAQWEGSDMDAIPGDFPVMLVSTAEARAFAEWMGLRLPFTPELEYASRGKDFSDVPWWDAGDPKALRANTENFERERGDEVAGRIAMFLRSAEPVDSRPEAATPTGLLHTLGNVAELTESLVPPDGGGGAFGPEYQHMFYGGSWSQGLTGFSLPVYGLAAVKSRLAGIHRGFRCVKGTLLPFN